MHVQMMCLIHAVCRRSWHTKFVLSPKVPVRIRKPITDLCRTFSVMKSKEEETSQSSHDSEKRREWKPPELSLLAKKIMEHSEQNRGHLSDSESCNLACDAADSFHSVSEMTSRLQSLTSDLDNALHKALEEQNESVVIHDSNLMFSVPSHKHQDDSVESIMLPIDIKASLATKPSPLMGTEDPSIPSSNVPCVGCGALLQCQHNTFPGFLPSELFKLLTLKEMKVSVCQRCHYIKHCDAFVEVSAKPEEFAEMISKIRPTKSVVVMVVDVMDINGSIIPDLMKYIGNKHPLLIVGNKVSEFSGLFLLFPFGTTREILAFYKSVYLELTEWRSVFFLEMVQSSE